MSQPHDRAALRTVLRERRRQLPPATRIAAAEAFAKRVLALSCLPVSGYLAGYWATDGEIGLHALQLQLPASLIYCLPLLHDDRTLRFAPWRAGDPLVTNRYGIPEPDISPNSTLKAEDMAAIVLPLVGFDARCHRLGMGGGWYDRSLAFRHHQQQRPTPVLIGAGFSVQHVPLLPNADWDVPLDVVCSEEATYFPEVST